LHGHGQTIFWINDEVEFANEQMITHRD
jgi:hypothetical protein